MPLIQASQSHEFSESLGRLPIIPLPSLISLADQRLQDSVPEYSSTQDEAQQAKADSKKRKPEKHVEASARSIRIKTEDQEQQNEQPKGFPEREIVYYVLSTDQITRQHLESVVNREQVTHLRVVLGEKVEEQRKNRNAFVTALTSHQVNMLNNYFPNITNLNLSNLGELGIGAVTALANSFTRLTHLNLANTYIYDTGLASLLQAVFMLNLLNLNLHNTGITANGISGLPISRLTRLQELDLSNNSLSPRQTTTRQPSMQAQYLIEAPFRNTLIALNLSNTYSKAELIQQLEKELRNTKVNS